MTNQTKLLYTAMILAGWCLAHLATAQDTNAARPDVARSEEAAVAEINGLVVDETITKVGRDFYEVFYSRWEPPPSEASPGEMSYTIFIKELPMPGRGSQVSVLMDDTQLFTQPVQPRYDVIESLAEYAVSLVSNYVNNYEQMSRQLGNEDQRGSGIF